MDHVKSTRPKSNIDVFDLMIKADKLMEKNQFKEAADAYYESAEIATVQDKGCDFIIARYENAAECYLKTKDVRVYECYNKVVDVDVKYGQINKAIENCFKYGYLLFVEIKEKGLFEKLYIKGEDLRLQHDLKHSCVITKFDAPVIEENEKAPPKAVSDAVDLRKKFQVTERIQGGTRITHESICRNCIQARADLDEFIKEETERKVETREIDDLPMDYL